jgi:DNA-binding response OmpR family regulator
VPRILIATDADRVLEEVTEALSDDGVSFTVCSTGQQVVPAVQDRRPDIAVLDLQIGEMGGMAVTMSLRLEESGGRLPHVPVLVLLDRRADVHLARRSGADGWLVKPLDALRLRRAVRAILDGKTYTEGAETPAGAGTAAG